MNPVVEAVVGASPEELDEIIGIMTQTAQKYRGQPNAVHQFEQDVNVKLAPYRIRMDADNAHLRQAGAPAMALDGWVTIRTPSLSELGKSHLRHVLSHELVHLNQMRHADARKPGGAQRMQTASLRRFFPQGGGQPVGPFDHRAYTADKQEIMAHARSTVDMLLSRGMDRHAIKAMLRRGEIPGRFDEPEVRRRFLKYASAYADAV